MVSYAPVEVAAECSQILKRRRRRKMKTHSTKCQVAGASSENRPNWFKALAILSVLVCFVLIPLSGCNTPPILDEDSTPYSSVKLTEGDTVSITFPGSPDLNTAQRIRRDGKIDMKTVGEVQAAGKTPKELEKDILKLYEKDLVLKEVSVILQSTSYPVYVSGAVLRPGKVMAERPISALEAIMEAGGFDNARANLKKVVVLRKEDGPPKHYKLNLKDELTGKTKKVFYLRPNDIVYVPEKLF
jgi:polysaccharide export outer membrane protein